MALTIDTQDLENYPGTVKRVTVDVDSLVPVGFEGDEQIVMMVSTTAYSNVTSRTAIPTLYLTNFKTGWCKSSGFAGSNGKFTLSSGSCNLDVKIDNTTASGLNSGYYTITLDYAETPLSGATVASDIEAKIKALTLHTSDSGFILAYKNAMVEFIDNKFWIVSGSISEYFTGSDRSSVKVKASSTNDASVVLGFNLATDSQTLAGVSVREVPLASNYTAGSGILTVTNGLGVQSGDCLIITDGAGTYDYFSALSGTTDTDIVVATTGVNGFDGIANSYTTVSGAKIQLLREQDPEGEPLSYYRSLDAVARFGVKYIINQIDYSG